MSIVTNMAKLDSHGHHGQSCPLPVPALQAATFKLNRVKS